MKKIVSLVLIIFMVLSTLVVFTGCNNDSDGAKEIVDMAGVTVEMPEKINKVICTTQNAMEFMVAMGLEDKLIGIHNSVFVHAWTPEYMKNTENIKKFGYAPSAEAVYEAGADLVIVKSAEVAAELRAVGITAITFKYGSSADLIKAVKMLGDVFGGEAKVFANRWTECYENTVATLRNKFSDLNDDDKIKAYFIDASGALDAGGLTTTVGGDHIVAEWFDIAGASLVTKEYTNISSINEEEILEINPEWIMIGGWCENTRKEQLLNDVKWADVDAVKNNNVYLVPVGFVSFERYAVEAPILLMYTASLMYPEFVEYDTVSEFQAFFNEYFGIDVSEEKINYMLQGLSPSGERMD